MRFSLTFLLPFAILGCGSIAGETSKEPTSSQKAVRTALAKHGFYLEMKSEYTGLGNSVTSVKLYGGKGDDACLVHLKKFTKLHTIVMNHSNVTDTGLENLKGLDSLQTLRLGYTKVTDEGLLHLGSLTNLNLLAIDNNKNISDAGLEHLRKLTKLQTLYLGGTNVTREGVKKLQKAIPNCRIYH